VLGRVKNSVNRLSSLIEEILTVASFEAGMTQVKLEDVHLLGLLDQVREMSIDERRVDIVCADDLFVVSDPVILRHILNQLVDNALKYAGDAHVSATRASTGELELAVRDHGDGIPAEERPRIFHRFYRGSHTGAGMGLGLPVSRELSLRLGAVLELEEPDDGGARFVIRFP
jgi:signal transduction histidine kinase